MRTLIISLVAIMVMTGVALSQPTYGSRPVVVGRNEIWLDEGANIPLYANSADSGTVINLRPGTYTLDDRNPLANANFIEIRGVPGWWGVLVTGDDSLIVPGAPIVLTGITMHGTDTGSMVDNAHGFDIIWDHCQVACSTYVFGSGVTKFQWCYISPMKQSTSPTTGWTGSGSGLTLDIKHTRMNYPQYPLSLGANLYGFALRNHAKGTWSYLEGKSTNTSVAGATVYLDSCNEVGINFTRLISETGKALWMRGSPAATGTTLRGSNNRLEGTDTSVIVQDSANVDLNNLSVSTTGVGIWSKTTTQNDWLNLTVEGGKVWTDTGSTAGAVDGKNYFNGWCYASGGLTDATSLKVYGQIVKFQKSGSAAFSGAVDTCQVTVVGLTTAAKVNWSWTSAPAAADISAYCTKGTNKFVLRRAASGASGLSFDWWVTE